MKVSVILTSYNHEQYIRQSIESILNQTYRDFELLIYDDASTDRSLDIISSYTDERIQVIASPFNRESGFIQYVVENFARGDYVAIAHSDDFWEKEKLEKQVEYLEGHPEVGAVFTHVNVVNDAGEPYMERDRFYYNVFDQKNRNRFQWLRHFFYEGNCLCHPSVMIRKNAYKEYRMYPKGLRQIPDFYMWIRLCLYSDIHILEDKLTNFRILKSERNTSAFRKDTSIRSSVEIHLVLKQFLELSKYEDFMQVFPEAGEYAREDCFLVQYALARLCLQESMPAYKKAYGLETLFWLLNNKEQAAVLECDYHFNDKDFFALTGQFDVYGLFPDVMKCSCNIYYDCGDGYSDSNMIRKDYELWMDKQTVCLEFQVGEINMQHPVRLRIDPIEDLFVRCRICAFRVNGANKNLTALNACSQDENGELFITADPNYEYCVDMDNMEQIYVSFEIERAPLREVSQKFAQEKDQIISRMGQEIETMQQEINRLEKRAWYRRFMFWRGKE